MRCRGEGLNYTDVVLFSARGISGMGQGTRMGASREISIIVLIVFESSSTYFLMNYILCKFNSMQQLPVNILCYELSVTVQNNDILD